MNVLNNFNINDFLANYWQQKPLLIRQAFPDFNNPITANELAGLACEEDIESRIIFQEDQQWSLENGPFAEGRFSSLPEKDWTLLVQAVDHHCYEVAQLRSFFAFIPNWRIDDIMVSYACNGGNVGPHYDNYSVFLIQGAGQRRWQIGPEYNATSETIANDKLRLLSHFECTEEYILNPGDILYLPPQVGHWGTSLDDDCITYSVGFRAPSHAEIISDYCDDHIQHMSDELRFNDASMDPQANPGEISDEAIKQVQTILQHQLSDRSNIASWFGRYMTQPKYHDQHIADDLDWQQLLVSHQNVYRDPASRFAYNNEQGQTTLYVNGIEFTAIDKAFAEQLCAVEKYSTTDIINFNNNLNIAKVLDHLFQQGSLYFDDDFSHEKS